MKKIESIDDKEYVKLKFDDHKNIAHHEDTYWYFDVKGTDAFSKKYNKSIKNSKSVLYAPEPMPIPREFYYPVFDKIVPRGKDYVTWRYIHPKYKPYEKGKSSIEKTSGIHQVIYKGKVIKQIVETGDCKKDAMILYTVKKLIYELLKQKCNDKELYDRISERSRKACVPRYEDISGMNLFHKRMFE